VTVTQNPWPGRIQIALLICVRLRQSRLQDERNGNKNLQQNKALGADTESEIRIPVFYLVYSRLIFLLQFDSYVILLQIGIKWVEPQETNPRDYSLEINTLSIAFVNSCSLNESRE
jgi:hypothetical protein